MKFTIQAADFAQALKAAQAVTDSRAVMPIYECVRIDADRAGITITSGTSEQQLQMRVPADVEDTGAVAVPLKTLYGYVSALTEEVHVTLCENGTMELAAGAMKSKIAVQEVDNYSILHVYSEPLLTADANSFVGALSSVAFAAEYADKAVLQCVRVEVDQGGNGLAVACDGRFLAKRNFSANVIFEGDVELNIPVQFVKPLCSVLQGQESLSLAIDKFTVCVTAGDRTFIFPQKAGTYIDWKNGIVNKLHYDKVARIDVKGFANIVRFSNVSSKTNKNLLVTLTYDEEQQSVYIASRGAVTEVDAATGIDYNGETLSISFNINYLQRVIDFFSDLGFEDMEVSMSGSTSIAMYHPVGGNSSGDFVMICPVRQPQVPA